MNQKTIRRFIILVLSAVLAGCSSASSSSSSSSSGENGIGKTDIILGDGTDIKSLDPQYATDIYSFFLFEHLYSRLLDIDDNGEIICELAESYEIVDDTTYHFVLHDGVKFHDGSACTANDVKFTIERAKVISSTASDAEPISEVTVNSDTDLTVKTSKPYPALLSFLAGDRMSIVSEAVVTAAEANGGKYGENPIGTGPFKFVEWAPNDHWKVERFDDYFGEAAKATSITVRIIPEASSRVIALETGEIDAALNVGAVAAQDVEANSDLVLEHEISPAISYLGLNTQKGALTDERVRQAVAYAIDKQQIVDVTTEGRGEIANSYCGKTVPGWDSTLEPYPYDPEKAKELLKEAGYENGLTLELYCNGDQNTRTGTLIQAMLADVGIAMNVNTYDWTAMNDALNKGDVVDLYILGWANRSGDPDYSFYPLFYSANAGNTNNCNLNDAKADQMIENARTEMDSKKRLEEYKELQQYLKEICPWVPLYYNETLVGRRADLQGFKFNATYGNYAGDCFYYE